MVDLWDRPSQDLRADSEKHYCREACVRALVEKWNLGWSSSWSTSSPHWTFCHKHSKELYTLDYVWASHDLQLDVHVRYDMDFNADHRPLEVSFCLDAPRHRRKTDRKINQKRIDWKDGDSRDFLNAHWNRISRKVGATVEALEEQVLHAISATPKVNWTRPARPIALQNAFAALEEAEGGPEKVAAARVVYREKRREQDQQKTQNFMKNAVANLIAKKNVDGVQAETLKCNGKHSSDRSEWSREASSHYADHGSLQGPISPKRGLGRRNAEGADCETKGAACLDPVGQAVDARA